MSSFKVVIVIALLSQELKCRISASTLSNVKAYCYRDQIHSVAVHNLSFVFLAAYPNSQETVYRQGCSVLFVRIRDSSILLSKLLVMKLVNFSFSRFTILYYSLPWATLSSIFFGTLASLTCPGSCFFLVSAGISHICFSYRHFIFLLIY